jgi:hypothetical protein
MKSNGRYSALRTTSAEHHAHAEGECEDLRPEQAEILVHLLAGLEPREFEAWDKARQSDAECGKDDMELSSFSVSRCAARQHIAMKNAQQGSVAEACRLSALQRERGT